MRILDRHILKSVVTVFISCVFVFLFMYVIIDVLSKLEDILKSHLHYSLFVEYYITYLPIMFVQVAPFSCLLSTLYTLSKLNHDNEIIAMRAAGLSIFYITKTVMLFGLMVSLLVLWINDRFAPKAMLTTQKIITQMDEASRKKSEKSTEEIGRAHV